jgi:hypothetical protein
MIKTTNRHPMPTRTQGRVHAYPFKDMKVGESFLAPKGKEGAVRSLASQYSKAWTSSFATRTTDEGLRVWRVE